MGDESAVPTYEELRNRTGRAPGSSWRVFGPDDHLGVELPHARADRRRERAHPTLVPSSNLDYELNTFMPLPHPTRRIPSTTSSAPTPTIVTTGSTRSISRGPPRSTAFATCAITDSFYAGVPDDRVVVGTPDISMSLVAEHGIVGRGILLDAERYFAGLGRPLVATETYRITPADLDAIAAHQRTAVQKGDIVLLRTGWGQYFLRLCRRSRRMRRSGPDSPGLDASQEMLEWLWDHNVSVIAADNTGVEAGPIKPGTEFWDPEEPPPPAGSYNHNGTLHRPLISLLGFHLGELWLLDDLARDCAEDWCYEFFLVAKPLNLLARSAHRRTPSPSSEGVVRRQHAEPRRTTDRARGWTRTWSR